jgi:hypothetical protein
MEADTLSLHERHSNTLQQQQGSVSLISLLGSSLPEEPLVDVNRAFNDALHVDTKIVDPHHRASRNAKQRTVLARFNNLEGLDRALRVLSHLPRDGPRLLPDAVSDLCASLNLSVGGNERADHLAQRVLCRVLDGTFNGAANTLHKERLGRSLARPGGDRSLA